MNTSKRREVKKLGKLIKWNGPVMFLLFLTGLVFSVLSSLDCSLLNIRIGFNPDNSLVSRSTLGVGLWTFESHSKPGECYFYDFAMLTSIIDNDRYYESCLFSKKDGFVSLSRVMALSAACISLTAIIINFVLKETPKVTTKIFVLTLALSAMCLELSKVACFLQINLCAQSVWLNTTIDSIDQFYKAESCSFGRGAFSSIVSASSYFIAFMYLYIDIINSVSNDKRSKDDGNGMCENPENEIVHPSFVTNLIAARERKTQYSMCA